MIEAAKPTGNMWILAVIALLGTTVVVNIFMATLASRSHVGYIENRTWEHDQLFQQQIDATVRFRELGLVPKLEISHVEAGGSEFQLSFDSTKESAHSGGFEIELSGKRGDDAKQDFILPLLETSSGIYRATLPRSISGLWMYEVILNRDGLTYRFSK